MGLRVQLIPLWTYPALRSCLALFFAADLVLRKYRKLIEGKMILPTKGIAPERALLSIGAQIILVLHQPLTVSQTWSRFLAWRQDHNHRAPVAFWWFTLGLDVLYSLGLLEFDGELLTLRRADAPKIAGE